MSGVLLRSVLGFCILTGIMASAQAPEQESGTLTINLTDLHGLKVAPGNLEVKSSQGKVVYSATVDGQVLVHLPYGRYSVEFESAWFPRVMRDVVIDRPNSFVELASAFVPEGGSPPVSISIKVDPAKSCFADGSLWAKLVGVYSLNELERSIVLPGGYALFEPVPGGSYVLVVVDGSKVRATLPIDATHQLTTATVSLSACK